MLNRVCLQGRLVADPEIRTTQNGVKVANMRLAVDRSYRKEGETSADFFTVIAWRTSAEFVERYIGKGQMIAIDGKLQYREWTDKDGKKRSAVEVIADDINFCESKRTSSEATQNRKEPVTYNGTQATQSKEQDLPF